MKVTVFWDVAQGSLIDVYRRSRVPFYLVSRMMEAASTFKTSVNFCKIMRQNILKTVTFIWMDKTVTLSPDI
jgi:hypothetical protein